MGSFKGNDRLALQLCCEYGLKRYVLGRLLFGSSIYDRFVIIILNVTVPYLQ